MAEHATRSEHPLPAVIMHWVHILSFFLLIVTGFVIHAHVTSVFGAIRQTHFIAMYVFLLTAITRIYWAFAGGGSSPMGKTYKVRDWRFFILNGQDWRLLGRWIAYYLFIRKTRPFTDKYNPLQKLTYGVLFPLGIIVLALTGFSMFQPTQAGMAWFANIFGGLNGVRLIHYWAMWVMIVFFAIHLYLALFEDVVQVPLMFVRYVPKRYRVQGDYPLEGTRPGAGSSPKPAAPASSAMGSGAGGGPTGSSSSAGM
jgi:Ni/Fe-hydrogenase 1 B-type cytochrome subunit